MIGASDVFLRESENGLDDFGSYSRPVVVQTHRSS